MNVGLDTSVILRLTSEPERQALRAFAELEALAKSGVMMLVSDLVVSEVYFALQYHNGVPKAEALVLLAQFQTS